MKFVKTLQPIALTLVFISVFALLITTDVSALNIQDGVNAARGDSQPYDLFGAGGVITTITNTLLFVVGALSVIMIIIGGLRYAISGGNATTITAAKNTILYAVVGLIVAFLAFAAVNFVLSAIAPGATGGYTDV